MSSTTDGRLVTERGATSIADGVVEKIAGIVARGGPGIYATGTRRARTLGAVREMIPGTGGPDVGQGVSVQVGRTQAAVDLDLDPSTATRSPTSQPPYAARSSPWSSG